jgi:hypothetical protein
MNKKRKIKERIRRSDLFLFYQLHLLLYLLSTLTRIQINDTTMNATKNAPDRITELQTKIKQRIIARLCYQTTIGKIKLQLLEIVKQFKKLDYKRLSLQWINKIMTSNIASYKILPISYPREKKRIVLPLDFALLHLCKSILHRNMCYTQLVQAIRPYIHTLSTKEKKSTQDDYRVDLDVWNYIIQPRIVTPTSVQSSVLDKKLDTNYGWAQEYNRSSTTFFIFDMDIRKLQQLKTISTGKSFYFANELLYNSCTHSIGLFMQKILRNYNI